MMCNGYDQTMRTIDSTSFSILKERCAYEEKCKGIYTFPCVDLTKQPITPNVLTSLCYVGENYISQPLTDTSCVYDKKGNYHRKRIIL